jgi:hypothetical protein
MEKLYQLAIVVSLLAGLLMPSAALAGADQGMLDILVLADGSTDALVQQIQAAGGAVRYQYRNAAVIAATVPVGSLAAVAAMPGVTQIEEDALVYLPDSRAGARHDERPAPDVVSSVAGDEIHPVDPGALDPDALPQGWANPFFYSGAYEVWPTTAGAGSIVAVVDSGVAPNLCLDHAVIGAPGYPDGYNASGDGIPANSSLNHYHGTLIGGVIASSCSLDLSGDPNDPLYRAQAPYLGWPAESMPLFGQAPGAQLYPVKVFPASTLSAPESVILDGLDHVLTLKKAGLLDIDIVNLSITGWTRWDGRTAYDRFIQALHEAGILVVTCAGNSGPLPNSIGDPATSFFALSVAALDYAPSSRVLY